MTNREVKAELVGKKKFGPAPFQTSVRIFIS